MKTGVYSLFTLLALNACSLSHVSGQQSDRIQQCPVCVSNADLACVDVTVVEATPRSAFGGEVYYFCSEECRQEFQKEPKRYVSKRRKP